MGWRGRGWEESKAGRRTNAPPVFAASSESFESTLRAHGLRSALALLNRRTPHRFTGLFRFRPPELLNVAIVDSWNENPQELGPAPIEETFCGYASVSGGHFATDDARADSRLLHHPLARHVVQSYCGVTILDKEGQPWGSLCHWDTRPCDLGTRSAEELHLAAKALADFSFD